MSYHSAYLKGYEEACKRSHARAAYVYRQHHSRFEANVTSRKPRLVCQDCGGKGGHIEHIAEHISALEECPWCEGTGYVTPHLRGTWLAMKREERNNDRGGN